MDLFNKGIGGHTEFRPGCSGRLTFDPAWEIQRGLCWREQLMCSTFGYRSAWRKLYKDVETAWGPKPASANYGFQVRAKQPGASNTAICKIQLAADTPAPPRSTNKVGEVIIETNEKDMANIRNDIKTVQAARGQLQHWCFSRLALFEPDWQWCGCDTLSSGQPNDSGGDRKCD